MVRYVLVLTTLVLGFGNGLQLSVQMTPAAEPDQAVAKPSQGTFTISGKTYKLDYAVAYEAKVFDDYMINVLASSEPIAIEKLKSALREGKGTDDKFSTFQPHVKLSFRKSGEFSYFNSYAEGRSFSISGGHIKGGFELKNGKIVGNAELKNEEGKKNTAVFDVKFNLDLIAAVIVSDEKPIKQDNSKPTAEQHEDSFNVYDLPIPKDATDIERKKLVEHIHYKSPSDFKIVSDYLIKQFDAQKWMNDDDDLTAKKSTILKRKKGASSLTVFVKPDGTGCTVTMMTEGLSWENKNPVGTIDRPETIAATSGILAEKFPVPDKASDVDRDGITKMVNFRSQLSAKELVEFYRKNLSKLGWKEKKEQTVIVEVAEIGTMAFAIGVDSIEVVIQDGNPKSKTRIMVHGNGLKWTATADANDVPKPEKNK